MFQRLRIPRILLVILIPALILAACERPLTSNNEEELPTPVVVTVVSEAETPLIDVEEEGAEELEAEEAPEEPTEEAAEDVTEEPADEVGETPVEDSETNEGEAPTEEGEAEDADSESDSSEDTDEGSEDSESGTNPEDGSTSEDSEGSTEDESAEESGEEDDGVGETTPLTHTVALGENLYRISVLYGVTVAEMAELNNIINNDSIYAGQVLLVPGASEAPADSEGESDSNAETGEESGSDAEEPAEPKEPPSEFTDYSVLPGDTLSLIAFRFGVSWVEIAEANGIINPNQIYSGQVLKIPVSTPGPSPEFTHVVQPGESLLGISLTYGVPWMSIAAANNLVAPYFIQPGQSLVIPRG